MSCYRYEIINETENPILHNVDIAVILVMENSNRFVPDPFLLNLTKKTVIQYNLGFKMCYKSSKITTSVQDIVHAYYTAFKYVQKYNNVIIFEEDAIVINKDISVYKKIDTFLENNHFDIFTFGSFSMFSKYDNDFYKLNNILTQSQAIIYSPNSIKKLIKMCSDSSINNKHIDYEYIGQLDNKFTYKYPLIVQLFPETENQTTWHFIFITKKLIKLFELDKKPDTWYLLYFICRNLKLLLIIVMLIITLIIINFTIKKGKNNCSRYKVDFVRQFSKEREKQ
jgi:hypothetical protein